MALHPDHLRRSRVDARDAEPRLFVADETARRPEFDLVAIEFAGTRIDGGIDADQHAIWCKILARRGFDPEAAKIHEIGRASCRGKSVSVRVDLGGRRIMKTKKSLKW